MSDTPEQCPECVGRDLMKIPTRCPRCHRLWIPETRIAMDHLYYCAPGMEEPRIIEGAAS